jgi:hypothetical protein
MSIERGLFHFAKHQDLTFGEALEALKAGQLVRRPSFNSGSHLYLEDSLSVKIRAGAYKGTTRSYELFIALCQARSGKHYNSFTNEWVPYRDKHQPGWTPSQADMLATDWLVVLPTPVPESKPEKPRKKGRQIFPKAHYAHLKKLSRTRAKASKKRMPTSSRRPG